MPKNNRCSVDCMSRKTQNQRGITIIELMIVVSVLAVIALFGFPSFREATANAALRGTTMDLIAAINTARADAVSLRVPVDLSPAVGVDWGTGWSLEYPAAPVDMTHENRNFSVRQGVTIVEASTLATLQFRVNGTVSAEAVFTICDGRTGETGRTVTLNRLGRVQVAEFACP
jgi:type IV fimbrial biogenesis protein FimT